MDHHASWIPRIPGVNHHSIFVTMISEKKSIKLVSRFETFPGGHFLDDFSNWEILCSEFSIVALSAPGVWWKPELK